MQGAGAALESILGIHEWVFGVERCSLVGLGVFCAVGGSAGETGSDGGLLHACAHVTPHHALERRRRCRERVAAAAATATATATAVEQLELGGAPGQWRRQPRAAVASHLVLVGNEGEDFVDAELRTLVELALAQRTSADGAGGPVAADACLHRDTEGGGQSLGFIRPQ